MRPLRLVTALSAIVVLLCALACRPVILGWNDPSPHAESLVAVDNGVKLEVLEWGGAGRPIVLLADFGHTAHVFDGFAEKLTGFGRIYGITRRGFGASSRPSSGYTEGRLAEDIRQVLDALKIYEPILAGHGMAGGELSRFAAEYSGRIAGLVFLDAAADPSDLPSDNPEYKQLSQNLPVAMRNSSPDLRSFQAYRDAQVRRGDPPLPESELRNLYEANPDGSVGAMKTPPAILEAVRAGALKRDYSKIRVPLLAFFSAPCKVGWQGEGYACIQHSDAPPPYEPKNDQERAAVKAFDAAKLAYTDRWKKDLQTAQAHVRLVDLPNANRFIFLSNERDVTSEMRQFVATLR